MSGRFFRWFFEIDNLSSASFFAFVCFASLVEACPVGQVEGYLFA